MAAVQWDLQESEWRGMKEREGRKSDGGGGGGRCQSQSAEVRRRGQEVINFRLHFKIQSGEKAQLVSCVFLHVIFKTYSCNAISKVFRFERGPS